MALMMVLIYKSFLQREPALEVIQRWFSALFEAIASVIIPDDICFLMTLISSWVH
jgi:hypothetical protein